MEILFTVAKAVVAFFIMLQLVLILLWVERKGSALIQDRVGANRANIFGGVLPFNLGIVNTFLADPLKGFHKEDIIPARADITQGSVTAAIAPEAVHFSAGAAPIAREIYVGVRIHLLRVHRPTWNRAVIDERSASCGNQAIKVL